MKAADVAGVAIRGGDPALLNRVQHGLAAVVVAIHLGVELVEIAGLGDGIEPPVTQEGAHAGTILLFDEAIVGGVAGTTAAKLEVRIVLGAEAPKVIVAELGTVIWLDEQYGKGQLGEAGVQGIGDDAVTAAENGAAATPMIWRVSTNCPSLCAPQ